MAPPVGYSTARIRNSSTTTMMPAPRYL